MGQRSPRIHRRSGTWQSRRRIGPRIEWRWWDHWFIRAIWVLVIAVAVYFLGSLALVAFKHDLDPAFVPVDDSIRLVDTTWDTISSSKPYAWHQVVMKVHIQRPDIDSLLIYWVTTSNVKSPAFIAEPVMFQVWWLDWTSGLPDSSRLEPLPDTIDMTVIPHKTN